VLERITRLVKRRKERGPRADVGPLFAGEAPTHLSDAAAIEGADTVNRLPSRDYIGAESGDLAPESPEAEAEAQRWKHERELYAKKNQDSGSGT